MMQLEHSCAISRKVAVGTNGRMQQQTLYTGVSALFLPMTGPANIELQFTLGRDYNAYFDISSDVLVGDQLLWKGKKFNVRTVSVFDVMDLGHKQCMVTEESN